MKTAILAEWVMKERKKLGTTTSGRSKIKEVSFVWLFRIITKSAGDYGNCLIERKWEGRIGRVMSLRRWEEIGLRVALKEWLIRTRIFYRNWRNGEWLVNLMGRVRGEGWWELSLMCLFFQWSKNGRKGVWEKRRRHEIAPWRIETLVKKCSRTVVKIYVNTFNMAVNQFYNFIFPSHFQLLDSQHREGIPLDSSFYEINAVIKDQRKEMEGIRKGMKGPGV